MRSTSTVECAERGRYALLSLLRCERNGIGNDTPFRPAVCDAAVQAALAEVAEQVADNSADLNE
jgi:hypothetical protein